MTNKKKIIIISSGILLLWLITKKGKKMISSKDLPFLNKVKDNTSIFAEKVISISKDLNIDPRWLMIVMYNESGLNPKAKNPLSTATGLIQFMESTAKVLGTTTANIYNMTNLQQLDLVKKYISSYAPLIKSVGDAYLAVFYPLALKKSLNYIFPENVVKVNRIFDLNKDGILTKQEFLNYVNQKYQKYLP